MEVLYTHITLKSLMFIIVLLEIILFNYYKDHVFISEIKKALR